MSAADEALVLSGPQPLVLRGEPSLWRVESGSVAVFTAVLRDGEVHGRRRFLVRLGEGATLLCAGDADASGRGLFAIAVGAASLTRSPLDAAPASEVCAELEDWIELSDAWVAAEPVPELAVRARGGERHELAEGEALAPARGAVQWLRVVAGRVELGGHAGRVLEAGEAAYPLGPEAWVEAREATVIEVVASEALEDTDERARGLVRHRRVTLDVLEEQITVEGRDERKRLETRAQRQAQRARAGLAELVGAIGHPRARTASKSALVEAAHLVAGAAGVELKNAPADRQDQREDARLESIARASHVRLRSVRLQGAWWRRDGGSLLAFERVEDERRPLALLHGPRGYRAVEPLSGETHEVDAKLASSIEGAAYAFQRPLGPGANTVVDLLRFGLQGRGRDIARVLVIGAMATALGMLLPLGTAALLDGAIPDADRRLLLEIGLGLGAAILARTAFRLAQQLSLLRIGLWAEAETQSALWDRLLTLPPSFFRRFSSGDLEARVSSVSDAGRDITGRSLGALFGGVLALSNFFLLLYFSMRLSLLAVVLAAAVATFTVAIGQRMRTSLKALFDVDGHHFGVEVQLVQAVAKLRVAGAESRAFTHWLGMFTERMRLNARVIATSDVSRVVNSLISPLSTALLFAVALGELRSPTGGLSLGEFLAFNVAFGGFLGGVTTIAETFVDLLDTAAQARRAEPILQAEPEVAERRADPGALSGRLSVEDAFFRYGDSGPDILTGVTVRAEPGEFIALVGPSGSGKSTILRLLLGFDSPREGVVRYDGRDLDGLDMLAVRRQLGVVLQGGRLSVGSILENIAGGGQVTLDEAWAAAEDAGLADEIRDFPMGMHTIVSEGGGNLSGGQCQRLLIARALARRPRILLFDEATSALDNRTQATVSESLARLRVTRVVVAHRLSTVRGADRIYVVEGGKIIEQGSHDELMSLDGLFARMMSRQMG